MLTSSHRSRWLLVLVCVAALVLSAPAAALAAGGGRARAASAPMRVIPVWAFVNHGSPVTGGRVVIIVDGHPVGRLHGRTSGVTNVNGVALVRVRRVPRRYTVVVQGGRVAGEPLRGSLRSLAVSGVGVVEVDPLTSLVRQLRGQYGSLSFGRASRLAKRYFGVPWWADLGDDVRDGPDWFNAQKYVDEARRYGSTDHFDTALELRVRHARSRFSQISDDAQPHSAFRTIGSNLADDKPDVCCHLTPEQLVKKVFGNLLEAATGTGSQALVGYLLGHLLQLSHDHLGTPLPKDELEQVREQLDALAAQLTELKGQVSRVELGIANSDASRLLHLSDGLNASIDYAINQLAVLAAAGLDAKGAQGLVDDVNFHIRAHLLAAPQYYMQLLAPTVGIASNPIKGVSHALGSSGFFDARKSGQVRAVYEYYATYQTQLTVLLQNYWATKTATYPPAYQAAEVAKILAGIAKTERESLKPTVPSGTFIDTRTPAFMWGVYPYYESGLTVVDEQHQTRTNLALGSFHNYQMPSFFDFKNLFRGATGDPRAWLQRQVEVRLNNRWVWGSEGISFVRQKISFGIGFCNVTVEVFDLEKDEVQTRGTESGDGNVDCSSASIPPKARELLRRNEAGLLLLRYLAPGESYYW
jgi:transcriptional regulator with XRE-family HTH domain